MSERVDVGQHVDEATLDREIDHLSLDQALRDFEVANARVIDLTNRLIAANERIVVLQRESDQTRTELNEIRAQHDAMRSSAAFRLSEKIWTLRNLLRI